MKHTAKRWTAWIVCTVILFTTLILPTTAAETLTDADWTKLSSTHHNLGCTSNQGMGVGDTYLYSVMIGGENTKAIVYRVHKDTGRTRVMKNGDTGEYIFTNMGHGNDVEVAVIDGVEYLYVLVGDHIEVYKVDGNELYQHASYNLFYNGNPFNVGAFAIYKVDEKNITFLFKWSNKTISSGKIAWKKTEGRIPVTVKCYLDSTAVEVDGEIRDFTGFANQGIDVYGDIVFACYAGCYEVETVYQSLILGFDLSQVEKGSTPTLEPREDLIIYMESSDYPRCFEIEDCGISSDGKMYFNANCWKSLQDTNHDGVFVLNDFVMPVVEDPPATEPPATEPPATEPPVTEPPAAEPPVTEPPATEPPATEPPATEPPATEPPATEPPATEPPATEPPATEPPATEPPATKPPVTEPPATEPPATEPPATEPPVTEPPATEPPATEPPATEPPATEPPATEPPVTEPPVTEPPATEPPVEETPVEETPIVLIAAIVAAVVAVVGIVTAVLKKKKK